MSDAQRSEPTPGQETAWKLHDQDIKTTRVARRALAFFSHEVVFLRAGGALLGMPAKPANKRSDAR
jgi:hypothetical protein